jgi:hypothetical protein
VLSSPAFAYRPFDGTDAAVADLGEFEVEFQPAAVCATIPARLWLPRTSC